MSECGCHNLTNHPQRFQLHNEVHARPYVSMRAPERASHLALTVSGEQKAKEWEVLAALCERFGHPPPKQEAQHFNADFGEIRLSWEQHTEFSTYTFYMRGEFDDPFAKSVLSHIPGDWLKGLPGEVIIAAHAAILPVNGEALDIDRISPLFADNTLIGAEVSGGNALAFTDFRIHIDGASRFLIIDKQLSSRQAGRLVRRLFEIEVYRIMALLAFPVARKLTPQLNEADRRLLEITTAMSQPGCDEPKLLNDLTALAAEEENRLSSTHYRFSAAEAYHSLVRRRVAELREIRIQGVQTYKGFMERRLEPAINTCISVAGRQRTLLERVGNAGQLLRTRVDITLEQQNQDLLASMDRRAQLQLRLQETVEGLSVAAITYYVVSLVGYLAKAGKSLGMPLNQDLVIGISIPLVALLAAFGVRQIRKSVAKVAAVENDST